MKSSIIVLILVALVASVVAFPAHIRFDSVDDAVAKNKGQSIKSANALLGLATGEAVQQRVATLGDKKQIRYQQFYKNIPIYGSVMTLEQNSTGVFSTSFGVGTVVRDLAQSVPTVNPKLTAQQALTIALTDAGVDATAISNVQQLLSIYTAPLDDTGTSTGDARLVYIVSFFYESPRGEMDGEFEANAHRPKYFIDAMNGEIVDSFDQITHVLQSNSGFGSTTKFGKKYFDAGTNHYPQMSVDAVSGSCTLQNTYVRTRNYKNTTSSGSDVTFTCGTLVDECFNVAKGWTCNGGYSPLNDAHFGTTKAFEMYQKFLAYHGSSVESQFSGKLNLPMELRLHYDQSYENAFFDGTRLTFGDGASTFMPLTSFDICAHELGHAFTQVMSNLAYSGESGGMNEAFSDISGEAVEAYINKEAGFSAPWNDFYVGQDVKKSGTALRNMMDPPSIGSSIGCYTDYKSGLDVHLSSGVYNKFFYKLTTYLDNGNNAKDGIEKAFYTMLYANDMLWSSSETMMSGMAKVKTAALTLKGTGGKYETDALYDPAFVDQAAKDVCLDPACVDTSVYAFSTSINYASISRGAYASPVPPDFKAGVASYNSVTGVPSKACTLRVTTSGSGGDIDLYVTNTGKAPTTSSYTYRSISRTANEKIDIRIDPTKTYKFAIYGYKASSNFKFTLQLFGTT